MDSEDLDTGADDPMMRRAKLVQMGLSSLVLALTAAMYWDYLMDGDMIDSLHGRWKALRARVLGPEMPSEREIARMEARMMELATWTVRYPT